MLAANIATKQSSLGCAVNACNSLAQVAGIPEES